MSPHLYGNIRENSAEQMHVAAAFFLADKYFQVLNKGLTFQPVTE
jgi:hypothetical protein